MRERCHDTLWVRNRGCYTGPLVQLLDEFLQCRAHESYSPHTVNHKRAFVAALSRWLERGQIPLTRLDEELLKRFRKQLGSRVASGDDTTERQLLEFLRSRAVIRAAPPTPIDPSPFGELIPRYERFLKEERGLALVTIADDLRVVRRFLTQRFTRRPLRLQALVPRDIHRFLLKEAERISRGRTQCMASTLRSFFRYLRQRGLIERDLAEAVPSVASYRLRRVPKFLPAHGFGPKS